MADHGDSSNHLSSKTHPASSSSSSTSSSQSSNMSKTSGKCPQTHFLLCALIVAQVGLLSLFLLWTIKTCFTRYSDQRVYIVYPVDLRLHAVSSQDDLTGNHLHGNQSRFMSHPLKDSQLDEEIIFTNESNRVNYFKNLKRKFSIVGLTRSNLLVFTLDYDVTVILKDQPTYDILSRESKRLRKFGKTRLKLASDRGQNGTDAGLSTSDCDVILDVVRSGMDVLWTETDSVWVRDPMPPIWTRYSECDVWITPHGDNQTESPRLMFLKSSPTVISFVKALKAPQSAGVDHVSLTELASYKIGTHHLLRKFNLRLCPLDR